MGTRGLIGFVLNDELKGSYNLFDMYPTGVGKDLQRELKAQKGTKPVSQLWAEFRLLAGAMRWVEAGNYPTEQEARDHADSHENVSNGKDWYSTLRKHQGSLCQRLAAGIATDDSNFLQDSLFCEWGYVFDMDAKQVCILEGFNQDPDKQWDRCKVTPEQAKADNPHRDEDSTYFGCVLAWTGTMDDFLALDMNAFEESREQGEAA